MKLMITCRYGAMMANGSLLHLTVMAILMYTSCRQPAAKQNALPIILPTITHTISQQIIKQFYLEPTGMTFTLLHVFPKEACFRNCTKCLLLVEGLSCSILQVQSLQDST